jgi:hypothetical protein
VTAKYSQPLAFSLLPRQTRVVIIPLGHGIR